jgi:hypothetical protein
MAGVAITAGAGTTIAADNVGSASAPTSGERIPYTKLDHGAAGSSSPVTVANPLPVGHKLDWIQVTPTLDTSIYASGDLLFDVTTVTSAALASGGAVELVSVVVTDEDEQNQAIDLYVTNLSTSWGTFNAAVAATDAMSRGIQAYIPIAAADFKDIGGAGVAMPATSRNIGVVCEASGSANLYLVGICRSGTPTHTASGLRVSLGFRQTAVS